MTAPVRMVILVVGAAMLLSLVLIGLLVLQEKAVPDVLPTVSVAALTGLLGLLTNTREGPVAGPPVIRSDGQHRG